MDFFDFVEKRRSVRAFTTKHVSEEDVNKILHAAIRAPSAGNLQAYRIAVVQNTEAKKALAFACAEQDFVAEAPVVLVFFAVPSESGWKYGQRGRGLYALQDATIAAAYAQLASTALGLSACWVGAFDDEEIKKICGFEKDERPVVVIPVGYPAEKPEKTSRKQLNQTVERI